MMRLSLLSPNQAQMDLKNFTRFWIRQSKNHIIHSNKAARLKSQYNKKVGKKRSRNNCQKKPKLRVSRKCRSRVFRMTENVAVSYT